MMFRYNLPCKQCNFVAMSESAVAAHRHDRRHDEFCILYPAFTAVLALKGLQYSEITVNSVSQ